MPKSDILEGVFIIWDGLAGDRVGTIYWVVGSSKFPFALQMVGDAFKVMHCNKDPLLKLTKFN